MKKKRFLSLVSAVTVTAVLALSCRGGAKPVENGQEEADSLAVATSADPAASPVSAEWSAESLPEEPVFDIVTSMGTIKVKLYSKTPRHRDNFIKLVQQRYYDGILFHRVINKFMIQAGDPYTRDTSKVAQWGEGGPDYTIPAEFVKEYYHKKGALAAARIGNLANPKKASSGSQFYIVQDEMNCLHLDDEYTVFGETISGFDVIDRISVVPTDPYDRPVRPVRIISICPDWKVNGLEEPSEEKGVPEEAPAVLPAEASASVPAADSSENVPSAVKDL